MKHLLFSLFFAVCLFSMASCSEEKAKAPAEEWAERIMEKYPNYVSNQLAQEAVQDSIKQYSTSFVGKQAALFKDIEFSFNKVIGSENDTTTVFLVGRGFAEIENSAEGNKYVIASIIFNVLGNVSTEFATSLNSGDKYSISGIVKEVDLEDLMLKNQATITPDDFYMGTFFIDDMKITKLDKK